MATSIPLTETAAVIRSSSRRNPVVLWHLLSLDAPCVAALWTWFLAAANRIHLPVASVLAMALAVWILYVADRLLDTRPYAHPDARRARSSRQELEARHHFHRKHRRFFVCGLAAASLALAFLVPHLAAPSLRLYLALSAPLAGYFVLIHTAPAAGSSQRLPKEIAVGVFFSAAAFIPTVSRQPGLRIALLPGAVLFAVLCSLNCLFIYAWEHPAPSPFTRTATRMALRFLPLFTIASACAGLALSLFDPLLPWPIPATCALSSGLLLALHAGRDRLKQETLRAAADLCLLTPLLLLPLRSR